MQTMTEYSKDPPFGRTHTHTQSFCLFQVPLKTSFENWARCMCTIPYGVHKEEEIHYRRLDGIIFLVFMCDCTRIHTLFIYKAKRLKRHRLTSAHIAVNARTYTHTHILKLHIPCSGINCCVI